ncbi:MAG: hypothetical protein GX811_02140 [Lentisphaerae bacterium]|jgi:predicted nucleotidyltransferase|nr:hypothetical protein [Lentisphaerota bacterium]
MNPEDLVEDLQEMLGDWLESVVLFGSAVAGDYKGKFSDYNILLVTKELCVHVLDSIAPVTKEWVKHGNPAPLLFTVDRLKKSTDVFPIELLDIRDNRKILYGNDPFQDMIFSDANLRLELEHELKGKMLQLREKYLLVAGNPEAVLELMLESSSTFLVLFRASLRLLDKETPACKMDALELLAKRLNIDISVFKTLDDIKNGSIKKRDVAPFTLFQEYLERIEDVVDTIDDYDVEG